MLPLATLSEQCIAGVFYWIGYRIGQRPALCLLLCLLLTILTSFGNKYAYESSGTRDFVPTDAPSLVELSEAERFFGVDGDIYRINVIALAKDKGSLARKDCALQLIHFIETSTDVVRIPAGNTSTSQLTNTANLTTELNATELASTYGFRDFCEPYCNMNDPLTLFLKAFIVGRDPLEYPISSIFGVEVNIANNVFSIDTNETSGHISAFHKAMLVYLLVVPHGDDSFGVAWEEEMRRMAPDYDQLTLMVWSNALMEHEAKLVGDRTAPSIMITILLLGAFFVLTSFREDPTSSKPWESLLELVVPLMGLVSTFGILSLFGFEYQSIIVATLFLVLAVCTDDGFIMLRAWDYALQYDGDTAIRYAKKTAPMGSSGHEMSIPRRTALMLKLSGPAITITTITNAMSFGIGIFSSTPAIHTFCLYTTVAILACFFFQVVLYSAIIALSANREQAGYRAFLCCFKSNSTHRRQWIVQLSAFHDWLLGKWVDMIIFKYTKYILSAVLLVYWSISVYGLSQMHCDLTADKLALPDSVFITYQREQDQAWAEMQRLTVLVTQPGNLLIPEEMLKLSELVREYETAPYSYGPASTLFWLPSYIDFIAEISDGFTYTELPEFLTSAGLKQWRTMVHINETACAAEQPECIVETAFSTGFTSVIHFYDRVPLLTEWRRIASTYPELGVLPYNDVNAFVDLAGKTYSTVGYSALASLACITLACLIIIPHIVMVCIAVVTVVSINLGVFGFLALVGVDLDPLAMSSMLMAVGFSVDYTAHIGYHYYRLNTNSAVERMRYSLKSMLWPMTQCAVSTIIAMSPILLQPSYLSFVFSNTIFFVVGFSAFHGVLVLPCILVTFNVGGFRSRESNIISLPTSTSSVKIVPKASLDMVNFPVVTRR